MARTGLVETVDVASRLSFSWDSGPFPLSGCLMSCDLNSSWGSLVKQAGPASSFCLAGNSHIDFNGKKLSSVHKRIKHLKMLYTSPSDVFKYTSFPSSS